MNRIIVSRKGAERIRAGHPWIFRSDLNPDPRGAIESGSAVEVVDGKGALLGTAFYSVRSQIALRLFAREAVEVDGAFFEARLREALALREWLFPGSQFYRLVHGEADRLPGLVIDRYGDCLSVQLLHPAVEARREAIFDRLEALLAPRAIVERSDVRSRELEGLEQRKGVVRGKLDGPVIWDEAGMVQTIDLLGGQKTGTFLDQRENHVRAAAYARGRAADLFSYSGGFAMQMAQRAESVVAVDISADACERIRGDVAASDLDGVEVVEANVFDWLRDEIAAGARYDTIVLDPPAFAKGKGSLPSALRGYKEINLRALQLLGEGGTLLTFSCSYHVQPQAFEDLVLSAANDAKRTVQILERLSAGRDHPMLLGMPESRYLKGLALRCVG